MRFTSSWWPKNLALIRAKPIGSLAILSFHVHAPHPSPPLSAVGAELTAVPVVAVGNPEANHSGAGLEMRHASGEPVVDRAGTDAEALGDLLLGHPCAFFLQAFRVLGSMVRRAHQAMQLLQGEGNQWGIESGSAFHGDGF